jgi:hypothetical protein
LGRRNLAGVFDGPELGWICRREAMRHVNGCRRCRGVVTQEIQQLLAHPALHHLSRERHPPTPAQRAANDELEREVDARLGLEESLNPAPRRVVETLERTKETLRTMIESYGLK